jgi:hypothetical protein
MITVIGIYGCEMPVGLLPSSSRCYKIVSVSAPSEWILTLCWILYLFTIGYDNYHAEIVRETILLRCGLTANPSILNGAMRESSYERVHGEEQVLAPVFLPVRSISPESTDSQSRIESVGEVDDDQNLYSRWESVGGRHFV